VRSAYLDADVRTITVLEGVPEMTRKATKANHPDRGRLSAKRKTDAVFGLLWGDELNTLSREVGVIAATFSS
jgi:hypothetical protein